MTRIVFAAATAATLAALLPAPASGAGFTYGVSAADVSSSAAVLWARAPKYGRVNLQVALDRRFRRRVVAKRTFATRGDDLTVQTRVAGLAPDTRYYYFFHQGRSRSAIGMFVTAPKANVARTIRFALTGDTEGHKDAQGNLYWNRHGAKDMATFNRMAAERNHFNVNLGDVIYSDPTGALDDRYPKALTLPAKRKTYQENLGYKAYQRIRRSGGMYNVWDDHEFTNDFTPNSEGCDIGALLGGTPFACDIPGIRRAGIEAFREYMPVSYSPTRGIYRSARWGRNLEVFFLDTRSFRSIRASEVKTDPNAPPLEADHVCDNPMGSKTADPAPQAPQRIRDLFAFVYPPASNPVSAECLAAINDPNRTFLGKLQFDEFTAAIRRSTAKWKVVVTSMPIQAHYFNPGDSWQGYAAERRRLLEFLMANVKNVVFLATDFHANWTNEVRITSFPEEGGEVKTGFMEFSAGGVASHLFSDEVQDFVGQGRCGPGACYQVLADAFLERPPPDGPGMVCSAAGQYGYMQLEVTAGRLRVALKTVDGTTVREPGDGGRTCGPYTLTAK